jgi:hypothetical protein
VSVSLGLKVDSLLDLGDGTVECESKESLVPMVGADGILPLSGIFIVVCITCATTF